MKLKVFEALDVYRDRSVRLVNMKHFRVTGDWHKDHRLHGVQDIYQARATIEARLPAPEDGTDYAKARCAELIGHEIFGELMYMVRELRDEILDEQYRPSDDPIMQKLHRIQRAMEGEDI